MCCAELSSVSVLTAFYHSHVLDLACYELLELLDKKLII